MYGYINSGVSGASLGERKRKEKQVQTAMKGEKNGRGEKKSLLVPSWRHNFLMKLMKLLYKKFLFGGFCRPI